jgi:methylenetetrahydrofolate reductase (NADPH)
MPVKSVKTLLWMKKEVPGVKINERYIEQMKNARDPETEGVAMAVELIESLRKIPGVRGIHLMPVLWESITPTIVKAAGLKRRSR